MVFGYIVSPLILVSYCTSSIIEFLESLEAWEERCGVKLEVIIWGYTRGHVSQEALAVGPELFAGPTGIPNWWRSFPSLLRIRAEEMQDVRALLARYKLFKKHLLSISLPKLVICTVSRGNMAFKISSLPFTM